MKLMSDHIGKSIRMKDSDQLRQLLSKAIEKNKIECILETGTHVGLGSTKFIAECIASPSPQTRFVTLEIDWVSWRQAKRNLAKFDFVDCVWGRSVDMNAALRFIEKDECLGDHEKYPEIFIDNISNPKQFYKNEIEGHLSVSNKQHSSLLIYDRLMRLYHRLTKYEGDNLLSRYLHILQGKRPLIVLDSAGGIGLLEFNIVCDVMENHEFFILLDDINHVKHFRSLQMIRANASYELLGVDYDDGWALAKYTP